MRIRSSEIKDVRAELLAFQDGLCPLCHREPLVPCLDHNHRTGAIRAVLCRGCNSLEGRITNNAPRSQVQDLPNFLRNLAEYLELHQENQTELIHPLHKSPEEKALRRNLRAKRARQKGRK